MPIRRVKRTSTSVINVAIVINAQFSDLDDNESVC